MTLGDENVEDREQLEERDDVRRIKINRARLQQASWWDPISLPRAQNVIDEEGAPQKISSPESKEEPVVTLNYPGRSATFYSVTEDEIENYAQSNFLSNISLALFGVSAGFSLACITALLQGGLSETATSVFRALWIATAVVAVVFLAASIYLYESGKRTKERWKSSANDT